MSNSVGEISYHEEASHAQKFLVHTTLGPLGYCYEIFFGSFVIYHMLVKKILHIYDC